jgi:hypothetical protein
MTVPFVIAKKKVFTVLGLMSFQYSMAASPWQGRMFIDLPGNPIHSVA